tara:strand:- start:1956 stop:2753 length:798 start_codon:yes stop_codon:yes gene_type:complete
MKKIFLIIYGTYCLLLAQTDIVSLSDKVGTEVDIHENRFYRIFPNEKGFISAQIHKLGIDKYRIIIVKKIKQKKTTVRRYINHEEFIKLSLHIDNKPDFTENAKISMYAGMNFLRADKIINQIKKPQYVVLKHSGNKMLKGTMIKAENNFIYIQTPSTVEKIKIIALDKISYRTEFGRYEKYRYYIYALTGIGGLAIGNYYNTQRPVGFNDYGFKRNDIATYRLLLGIIGGLIFSSEVFDAISTLLTPSETIILSESEYEEENFK